MLGIKTETPQEGSLTVYLEGNLDTIAALDLDEKMKSMLNGVEHLVVDLESLEYVSSSGLRVLLSAYKTMVRQGDMQVVHVSDNIQDIFDMTGFSNILNIQS